MSLNTKSSHHKRTHKYRPIERPDGVIVLQRPYQPPSSPRPTQQPKFEKHIPTFSTPATSEVSWRKMLRMQEMEKDCAWAGTQFDESENERYEGPIQAGRGGYSEIYDEHKVRQDSARRERYIIERFLVEEGPWGAWATREGRRGLLIH